MKSPRAKPTTTESGAAEVPAAVLRHYNSRRQYGVHACWSCGIHEGKLAEVGKKLLACSRCRNIGRKVLYCSP